MKEVMKRIFAIAFAVVLGLGLLSCNKEEFPEGADMSSVRVALTPDPGAIPAEGGSFEAAVVVNQGPSLDVPCTRMGDGKQDPLQIPLHRYIQRRRCGRGTGWSFLYCVSQHYRQEAYRQPKVYRSRRPFGNIYNYTVS